VNAYNAKVAHDVFLSFSSKDADLANDVAAACNNAGVRCWISTKDIDLGSRDYAGVIDAAIESSTLFLILFSTNSRDSPDVANEVELAKECGCTIIPVLIEDTPLRGPLRYRLITYEWFDKRRVLTEETIPVLVAHLRRKLGGVSEPVEAPILPQRGGDISATLRLSAAEMASGLDLDEEVAGKRICITLPAGLRTGKVVRVHGAGHKGLNGGENGDLLLKIDSHG